MALIWDYSIRGLFINRGIKAAMAASVAITVYKGTQPSGSDIVNNWSNYKANSSDFLAHYSGSVWTQQPYHGQLLTMSTNPTVSSPAFQSGEATWAIIWMTNPLFANIDLTTIPTTSFIIVPCSNTVGKGVLRFEDPLYVQNQIKAFTETSITAAF